MDRHTTLLSVIILGVFVLTLALSQPGITGYVPTSTFSQSLDIRVSESQRFNLGLDQGVGLTSISLSGQVTGQGLVNVYLNDGSERKLIYTNRRRKGSSMEVITGLAHGSLTIKPGEKINENPKLPDNYVTVEGGFVNSCVETCVLEASNNNKLSLDVLIDEDTTLDIRKITFSTS